MDSRPLTRQVPNAKRSNRRISNLVMRLIIASALTTTVEFAGNGRARRQGADRPRPVRDEAIRYVLSRRERPCPFVDDGPLLYKVKRIHRQRVKSGKPLDSVVPPDAVRGQAAQELAHLVIGEIE